MRVILLGSDNSTLWLIPEYLLCKAYINGDRQGHMKVDLCNLKVCARSIFNTVSANFKSGNTERLSEILLNGAYGVELIVGNKLTLGFNKYGKEIKVKLTPNVYSGREVIDYAMFETGVVDENNIQDKLLIKCELAGMYGISMFNGNVYCDKTTGTFMHRQVCMDGCKIMSLNNLAFEDILLFRTLLRDINHLKIRNMLFASNVTIYNCKVHIDYLMYSKSLYIDNSDINIGNALYVSLTHIIGCKITIEKFKELYIDNIRNSTVYIESCVEAKDINVIREVASGRTMGFQLGHSAYNTEYYFLGGGSLEAFRMLIRNRNLLISRKVIIGVPSAIYNELLSIDNENKHILVELE